jgi:DNA anti-recombination protein RmuC
MADNTRDKIEGFKDGIQKLQRNYDQAKGAYDTQLKALKDKFGVSTLEAAQKLLKEKMKKRDDLETALNKAVKTFETNYGETLGEA